MQSMANMSGKRNIKDASSGTSSKRLKHDDDELLDPNTLVAMPDDVLDMILNMLDLRDKKPFSEVCKKFNGILNWRRNLQKICFKVQKENADLAITRPYTNISVSYANGLTVVPKQVWKTLTPNLTAFKVVKSDLLNSREFLSILPQFANLSHLDLVVPQSVMNSFMKKQQTFEDPIEMPNLKHLRMNIELFQFLNDSLVNFASAKNLRSIQFSIVQCDSSIDFNMIRSFISNQRHLTLLELGGDRIMQVFNEPLKMQSQLEEFNLTGPAFMAFMTISNSLQDNLCDFIDSQRSLKNMNIDVKPDNGLQTVKMTRLLSKRLDLPLTKHRIEMQSNSRAQYSNGFKSFSLDELQTAVSGPANIATTELEIMKRGYTFMFNQTFPSIVMKFPNLTYLDLEVVDKTRIFGTQTSIINSMNTLQHLKHLRLDCSSWTLLNDVTIPTLECIELGTWSEKNLRSRELTDFIGRHRRIHHLKFRVDGYDMVANYTEILGFSLKNLEQLKNFAIKDYTLIDKNEKTTKKSTLELILTHARLGFVYEHKRGYYGGTKDFIMKRHDSQLVSYDTKQAKWQKLRIQQ